MWRKFLRAIGCLGYLGMLGVTFGLVSYLAFSQFVRRGVTPTPDLTGLPEADAVALLNDQGLEPAWSDDERYDERVPAGHVLLQRPSAGTLVKRGSQVTIVLSRGPQLLQVPDVVGSAPQAAQVTLAAAGLTVGRTLAIYSRDGRSGTVIGQRPAGAARAERAAAVDLFLARETSGKTWIMPDLVDKSYDDVRRFFTAQGFRPGRVSYEIYTGIEPGTVLRQFPQAGYPLHRGDVIALTVAAPEPGTERPEAGAPEGPESPGGGTRAPQETP